MGASDGVIVSKLDLQIYTSELESHWVRHSYGLVSHLSKKLSKLPNVSIIRSCEFEDLEKILKKNQRSGQGE